MYQFLKTAAQFSTSQKSSGVMSSAIESKLRALFINTKQAILIHKMLKELRPKQPCTPIQTVNSTACGVINNKIQPKATKAMDM